MSEQETKTVVIPVDDNLPNEIARLAAEGWQPIPGVKPIAVYQLCREKPANMGIVAKLVVDDTKVHILRANGDIE